MQMMVRVNAKVNDAFTKMVINNVLHLCLLWVRAISFYQLLRGRQNTEALLPTDSLEVATEQDCILLCLIMYMFHYVIAFSTKN